MNPDINFSGCLRNYSKSNFLTNVATSENVTFFFATTLLTFFVFARNDSYLLLIVRRQHRLSPGTTAVYCLSCRIIRRRWTSTSTRWSGSRASCRTPSANTTSTSVESRFVCFFWPRDTNTYNPIHHQVTLPIFFLLIPSRLASHFFFLVLLP